jgi:very-short-patch-repair endonuclease
MKRMNVDRARGLRTGMTDAEQALWYRLRNRQLNGCKFRRQHEIDRYVVDFICTERMLVVKLDGGQHLTSRTTTMHARVTSRPRATECCVSGTMTY